MNIKQFAPWNWFKQEEELSAPVKHPQHSSAITPVSHLHDEIDRLFNEAFNGLGSESLFNRWNNRRMWPESSAMALKPDLDIKENEKHYIVSTELPGVNSDDVNIEVRGNILTVRGEKQQEKTQEDENYHCIERSYGSFERVLTLPRDANSDDIDASFKDGVLTITIKRQAVKPTKEEGRKIEVKAAA